MFSFTNENREKCIRGTVVKLCVAVFTCLVIVSIDAFVSEVEITLMFDPWNSIFVTYVTLLVIELVTMPFGWLIGRIYDACCAGVETKKDTPINADAALSLPINTNVVLLPAIGANTVSPPTSNAQQSSK